MRTTLLLSLLAVPALSASPAVRLSGGPKAEDKLRRFVEQDAALKARLDDAIRREEAFVAESRETDLRDAVSDFSGDRLQAALEKNGADKRRLVSSMPGMSAAPAPVSLCSSIADCPTPELAADVTDPRALAESVRRLVRPWMVLQQARGSEAVVAAIDGPGDAAISVKLKDIDAQPLIINVSPRLLGGFKVWFERPLVLAALYGREREAILNPAR